MVASRSGHRALCKTGGRTRTEDEGACGASAAHKFDDRYQDVQRPKAHALKKQRSLSQYAPVLSDKMEEGMHTPWASIPDTDSPNIRALPSTVYQATMLLYLMDQKFVPHEVSQWHGHLCYKIERTDHSVLLDHHQSKPRPDEGRRSKRVALLEDCIQLRKDCIQLLAYIYANAPNEAGPVSRQDNFAQLLSETLVSTRYKTHFWAGGNTTWHMLSGKPRREKRQDVDEDEDVEDEGSTEARPDMQ